MNKKPIYTDFLNAQWKPAPMFYGFKPNVRPYILPNNRGKLPMPKSGHIQFGRVSATDNADFNPLPNKPELQLPGKIFYTQPIPQQKFLNAATVKLINSGKVKAQFKNDLKVNPLSIPIIEQLANNNLKLISLEMIKNAVIGLKLDPTLGTEQQQLRARSSYDNLIVAYSGLVDKKQDDPENVKKIILQYEKEMVAIYGPSIKKPVTEETISSIRRLIIRLDNSLTELYEMIEKRPGGIAPEEKYGPPEPDYGPAEDIPPEEEYPLPPKEEDLPPPDLDPAYDPAEDVPPPEEDYIPPPPEEPPEYVPPGSLDKLYEILTGSKPPVEITSVVFLNKLLDKATGSNVIDEIIKDYQFVKNGVPLSRVFKDSPKPDKDIGDLINAIMSHKMGWGTDTNMGQKTMISKIYNRLVKAHNYAYKSTIPTIKKGVAGRSLTKENLAEKINDIFIMTNALITYDKKLLVSAKGSKKPKPTGPESLPPGSADVPPPPPKKKPKPPKPTSAPPGSLIGSPPTGAPPATAAPPPTDAASFLKASLGKMKGKLAAEEDDDDDEPKTKTKKEKVLLTDGEIKILFKQAEGGKIPTRLLNSFTNTDDPISSLELFFKALSKMRPSPEKQIILISIIENLDRSGKKYKISIVKPPLASDAYNVENIQSVINNTEVEAKKILNKEQAGPGRKRKSRKRPTKKSVKKLSADVNNQILRLLRS